MKYAIGLDIGITSIGYAVMLLDDNDQPCRIMKMGSRIFEAAENPKDGSSLAAPRRENRGMRRRLRRKRFRKERIKSLIEQSGIMRDEEVCLFIFHSAEALNQTVRLIRKIKNPRQAHCFQRLKKTKYS